MDNIQKLREARTLNDANVILDKLHASGSVRKLVEVSFMTRTSADRSTQDYGMSCLNEAVSTLKDSETPTPKESPGLKTKGNHFVQEEELDNHNNGQREEGSEQSSDNTPPYPQEGTKDGDEDMQNAPDTENQMTETDDVPYNILENTGLHPDIAKKMGTAMPKIPPMDSGDQMKQMQYTMKKYHETVVLPLIKHAKSQDAAIRKLSTQIRETKTMTLDFPSVKENSIASFRETTGTMTGPMDSNKVVPNKGFELNEQRSRMTQLNNALAEQLT